MKPRWSRREFLERAFLQLSSLPLLSLIGCSSDPDAPPLVEISRALRAMLRERVESSVLRDFFGQGEPQALDALGSRYLFDQLGERRPRDADVMALLQPTMELLEGAHDDATAIETLHQTIEHEFSERNVLDLAGWTLAPTELALAALYFSVR